MEWTEYLKIGVFQGIITITVWFISSYIKEKGKNLATREDIHEITRQIESAKIDYAKELEGIKSQLNAKFHAQTVRFQKEFQIYEEVWKTLIEVRNATVKLRPPGEFYTGEGRPVAEEKEERFKDYREAFRAFYLAVYANRPFFPLEIFSALEDLLCVIFSEASDFKTYQLDFGIDPLHDMSYWDNAEKNIDLIVKKTDDICEVIRQRIEIL